MKKTKIIFLCTGNSARSQMAEAILRKMAGDYFEVYSAGFEPKKIHPMTIKVMEEDGYDLRSHASKSLEHYLGKVHFGIIVTVCSNAEKLCPTFPDVSTRLFWDLEDPAAYMGSEEQKLNKFREIQDVIKEKLKKLLMERDIPIYE